MVIVTDSLATRYRPTKIEDMVGNSGAKAVLTGMVQQKKFPNTMLLHGGTGMGKCVVGSTQVYTDTGVIAIADLHSSQQLGFVPYTKDFKILNGENNYEQPSHTYANIVEHTYKICFGYTTLEGTPEHPVLLHTGEFKELSQLCIGDQVCTHDTKVYEVVQSIEENHTTQCVYDLTMPDTHTFVANNIVCHNTTMARMIAQYVNCDTGDACGTCPSCLSAGNHLDVLEMNMSDTRGIDDIRTLIAKSQLAPRFNQRVFILDEIHQCFPAAVQILLADNSFKQISEITPSDRVCSFDFTTSQRKQANVSAVYHLQNFKPLVEVCLDTGVCQCTYDHRWWSITRQDYIAAYKLFQGEMLLAFQQEQLVPVTVQSINTVDAIADVFDISVDVYSNYFVKVDNSVVLVHNCTPQAKEAMLKPLEEPPRSTMFILCTTNPEKLSKTILGRCQQIAVSPPTIPELIKFLISVAKREGVQMAKSHLPALQQIAEMSMGHCRNALQLLETYIALRASGSTNEYILESLGQSAGTDVEEAAAKLLSSIVKGQGKEVVRILYSAGQSNEIMAILLKLKWLVDFRLTSWAQVTSFSPPINKQFEQYLGNHSVTVVKFIEVLNCLQQAEITLKTVPVDERVYFTSVLLKLLAEHQER